MKANEAIEVDDDNEFDLDEFIKNTQDELTIARSQNEKEDLHRQLQMAIVKRTLYKKLLR